MEMPGEAQPKGSELSKDGWMLTRRYETDKVRIEME
jgi:hypothetical protein